MSSAATLIKAKSNFVKASIDNLLADIEQHQLKTLSDLDVGDLKRLITTLNQLIELGEFVEQQESEVKQALS
jgi:hypothetical protein